MSYVWNWLDTTEWRWFAIGSFFAFAVMNAKGGDWLWVVINLIFIAWNLGRYWMYKRQEAMK